MNLQNEKIEYLNCPRAEIAEYIDGELSANDELSLEFHLADCKVCLDELNAQKKVSTTLEILLEKESELIELPENFTKIVTANAESNLEGLRSPQERSKALLICVILFLMIAFGFSIKGEMVLFAVERFGGQMFAVGGFVLHLFYTLAIGISAVFGSLTGKFIFSSTVTVFLIIAAFVAAFFTLSRMVFRYNRTQKT